MERPVKQKLNNKTSLTRPSSASATKPVITSGASKPPVDLNRKLRSKFTVANKPLNPNHQLDSKCKTTKLAVPLRVRAKLQLNTLKLMPVNICGSPHSTPAKNLVNLIRATHKYSARRSVSAVEIRRGQPMARLKLEPQFQSILQPDADAALSAGQKIYNFMILTAWRNRRQEVGQLREELKKIKTSWMRSKQRSHVMTALYESENKHYQTVRAENDQLQKQLMESLSEGNRIRQESETREHSCFKLKKEIQVLQTETERSKFEYRNQTNRLLVVIKDQEREIDRNKGEISTLTEELQRLRKCDQIHQEIEDQLDLKMADLQMKYRATIEFKISAMIYNLRKTKVPWIWFLCMLGHSLVPVVPKPQLTF